MWGFVTIAYAMFALLLAFSEGESWGWTGYRVLGLFVTAALSFALFVIIENEVDKPLVDLRVFRSFPFVLSLVLLGITITGLFSGALLPAAVPPGGAGHAGTGLRAGHDAGRAGHGGADADRRAHRTTSSVRGTR